MRAILAWKVLVACLALAGCAKADDATAATFKPRAPTAWSVISSNPSLSEVAGVIQRLELQSAYDRAFSGTLLLPTNEAIYNYLSEVEPLHLDPATNRSFRAGIEETMWGALLPYHALPRAVSTRQKAAAVTYSTTYFDSMSTVENSADTAARTLRPTPTSSPHHKLTFLCRSGLRSRIVAADVAPQTRSCQATSIRDEQNNRVTFASTNTVVLGGGMIHTVNAVLKPDNVYQSLALLLESDPELSIIREIIKATYPTCLYDSSSYGTYDLDSCCSFGQGAYTGNGNFCGAGESLYLAFAYGNTSYSGRRLLQTNTNGNNIANCTNAGTCALEGLRGTLALPTNRAFSRDDFGPTNSEGVPTTLPPQLWKPIVQFHFIRALGASDLMRYDRTAPGGRQNVGFPNPPQNVRQNLLGVVRNDNTFRLSFQSVTAPGQATGRNRLSIQFPSTNNAQRSSDIQQADRIIPPHFVHKVNRVMEPPCGARC